MRIGVQRCMNSRTTRKRPSAPETEVQAMRIMVVGSGVVGYATGRGLASQGHDVVYCDKSPERRSELATNGHGVVARVGDASECDVYVMCAVSPADTEIVNSIVLEATAS